jgi:hypothetical protein
VELEIPVSEVKIGETIIVRPGEKIEVDGEVASGPITGIVLIVKMTVVIGSVQHNEMQSSTCGSDGSFHLQTTIILMVANPSTSLSYLRGQYDLSQ